MAGDRAIVVSVLTWNLFHGRDFPPEEGLRTLRSRLLRTTELGATHAQVNRSLLAEFTGWLAARPWDVAFLQEAPPRWLRPLAAGCGASGASALTSRNFLAAFRAAAAHLNPDLIASNEGGSNQVLLRPPARLLEVRRLTLRLWPERRRMLWARVGLVGGKRLALANVHATAGDPRAAAEDVELAAERAVEWAGGDSLVFGGDLNLRPRRQPEPFDALERRFGLAAPTAPGSIDHLLASGLEVVRSPATLPPEARDVPGPRGLDLRLSDHAPVGATFSLQ
jgi:endonuclease/exonuclease/phosphatase family metal-dependent hydrolase